MGIGSFLGGLGSALSGAAGIAGLFGGGSSAEGGGAKKAKAHALDYDRRRIKAIVDGAGDAGIHPLVALGAQGSGSFAAPVVAGAGFGDAVSRGLGVLGEAVRGYGDYYEQDQDRRERAEDRAYQRAQDDDAKFQRILDDQRRIKQEDQALKESEARIAEHMANARAANARAVAVGAVGPVNSLAVPGQKYPRLVDAFGSNWDAAPSSDAESFENRYGDIVSELFGISNLFADWWRSAPRVRVGRPPGNPSPGSRRPLVR